MKKLTVSLSVEDIATIDRIVESNPLAKRHTVLRAALRAALGQMAQDANFALNCLLKEVGRG